MTCGNGSFEQYTSDSGAAAKGRNLHSEGHSTCTQDMFTSLEHVSVFVVAPPS